MTDESAAVLGLRKRRLADALTVTVWPGIQARIDAIRSNLGRMDEQQIHRAEALVEELQRVCVCPTLARETDDGTDPIQSDAERQVQNLLSG